MRDVTLRSTLLAGAGILALWGANWALRSVHLGGGSLVVALVIASVQVILGALFFMELATASASLVLAFLTAIGTFGLLIAFLVSDVATREPEPLPPPATHPATLPEAR
jgi:hypothetical protein